jgi:CubicO group peptidase (beta-lactamase class C family)
MVASGGELNGCQIVPEAWAAESRHGDKSAFRNSTQSARFPNGAYKNQWWLKDADVGIQLAMGIHGQMIYIDRSNEMIGVKLSSWPAARLPEMLDDTLRAFEAIAASL